MDQTPRRAPYQGRGVNEFFGVHPGSTGSRNVTITRSSGAAEATRYQLSSRGNDGTFTAPSEVELPLNQAVSDPANNMVLESFMNTVAASQPLGGENMTFTWKPDGKGIPLSHEACTLFDVQPDVAAGYLCRSPILCTCGLGPISSRSAPAASFSARHSPA